MSTGVLPGIGGVDFYLYLGVPDASTTGQFDAVDEPFSISVKLLSYWASDT